jgi:cytochrome c556
MSLVQFLTIATVLLLTGVVMTAQAFAQQDIVDKRKDVMQSNNADVKAIGKAAEAKDYATIELKAKDIMNNLDAVVKLFPQGSASEKSRAHPDIWTKPDEFKNKAANAHKAAEALSKAAAAKNEAEVNTKVKDLGNARDGACGECHKMFRTDFRKGS